MSTATSRASLAACTLVLATVLALALTTGPAVAAVGPVWQVTSETVPTNLPPGGSGEYLLRVRNIGTATTDGSQITVVDHLPAGVTATAVGGTLDEFEPPSNEYWNCEGVGTSLVTCTTKNVIAVGFEQILEYGPKAPLIAIDVAVAPGAAEQCGTAPSCANRVTVAGGGAGPAASSTPATIDSAVAPFGLASFEQLSLNAEGSPAVQAGAHPYQLITSLVLNNPGREGLQKVHVAGGEAKDLEVGLPPGLVGNPDATPRCRRAAFDEGRRTSEGLPLCPADTQVGTVTAAIANPFGALVLPVYNLEPPPGEPAQFGFAYQFRVGFIDFGVRTGEGYAVRAVSGNIVQLGVLRLSLAIWGVPADHRHDGERGYFAVNGSGESVASDAPPVPLLTNPTSCGTPLRSIVSADSWTQPALQPAPPFSYPFTATYPVTDNRGNPISIQGCSRLAFKPGIEVKPETSATSTPTGLEVKLTVPQNASPEGLATANLKDTTITLPAGLVVSPSVANGLQACTPEQIGLSNGHEPSCPDASKIGTVTVHSPLLSDPLTGSVYVAQQGNNPFHSLLAIYLTAEADGALVKLAGHVQPNPATGQLTVSFDENPQLPFSDLTVNMAGGPRAALMTPATCGTYTTTARLTGWNGAEVTPTIAPFRTTTGCTQGFAPSFTAGTTGNVAGAFGVFSTTISRGDSDQPLGQISVTTPPGMLGMLSKVPLCTEAQASTETCPAASLIGHTTATAGPGPDPVTVTGGQVFLTGPYKGAPFGLDDRRPRRGGPVQPRHRQRPRHHPRGPRHRPDHDRQRPAPDDPAGHPARCPHDQRQCRPAGLHVQPDELQSVVLGRDDRVQPRRGRDGLQPLPGRGLLGDDVQTVVHRIDPR